MNSQLIKPYSLLAIGLFYAPTFLMAQSLPGLWLVQEVSMGDQSVTPQERWFRYDDDGNFSSGNGWLKHSEGSYVYNPSDSSFETRSQNEPKDEFGAFKLWFEGERMIWQRMEADMQVTVKLERIEVVPPSLVDQVQGLWQLDSLTFTEFDLPDQETKPPAEQLFLRWDREYRVYIKNQDTRRGYWHLHGHRPELILISNKENPEIMRYSVQIEDDVLSLTIIDGNSRIARMHYHRADEFI